MRLLLIEDSERLRRSLTVGLQRAGFTLDATGDGNEGLWFAREFDYDVILLDLMLPGLDGWSLLRQLRQEGRSAHVLILSARSEVEDRVIGLDLGADDYLPKPFSFEELLARIRALIRRGYGTKSPRLSAGPVEMDTTLRKVSLAGEALDLTPREYTLLELFLRRKGAVVTRKEIAENLYGFEAEPASNAIDALVYTLRRKLKPHGDALIQSRRGFGYGIVEEGAREGPEERGETGA
jgi:two-component system OmpR family response regulator